MGVFRIRINTFAKGFFGNKAKFCTKGRVLYIERIEIFSEEI